MHDVVLGSWEEMPELSPDKIDSVSIWFVALSLQSQHPPPQPRWYFPLLIRHTKFLFWDGYVHPFLNSKWNATAAEAESSRWEVRPDELLIYADTFFQAEMSSCSSDLPSFRCSVHPPSHPFAITFSFIPSFLSAFHLLSNLSPFLLSFDLRFFLFVFFYSFLPSFLPSYRHPS